MQQIPKLQGSLRIGELGTGVMFPPSPEVGREAMGAGQESESMPSPGKFACLWLGPAPELV